MSTTDDRLEILIGKLLDGEISAAEQRILDRELDQSTQARELLTQMQALHECCREVVGQQLGGGLPAQEVFEKAWRQSNRSTWRRVVHIRGLPRFAAGLAAGLILGLIVHLVLVGGVLPARQRPVYSPTGGNDSILADDHQGGWLAPGRPDPRQITREVEWYGFTDQQGNQWLIEGFREGMAKPASYHGGL